MDRETAMRHLAAARKALDKADALAGHGRTRPCPYGFSRLGKMLPYDITKPLAVAAESLHIVATQHLPTLTGKHYGNMERLLARVIERGELLHRMTLGAVPRTLEAARSAPSALSSPVTGMKMRGSAIAVSRRLLQAWLNGAPYRTPWRHPDAGHDPASDPHEPAATVRIKPGSKADTAWRNRPRGHAGAPARYLIVLPPATSLRKYKVPVTIRFIDHSWRRTSFVFISDQPDRAAEHVVRYLRLRKSQNSTWASFTTQHPVDLGRVSLDRAQTTPLAAGTPARPATAEETREIEEARARRRRRADAARKAEARA